LPDSTGGEFLGISWDPGGNSFVTPALLQSAGAPLAAIFRVVRTQNGQWVFGNRLTTSGFNGQGGGNMQIYPAISPSGAGLAYFDVFFPDILTNSQAAIARLIVANSDGTGARVVTTFNQGFYPAGLAWSRDGNQLVFSIAPQLNIGTGFLTLINPDGAVVRSVSTSGGTPSAIPGIGNSNAFFPSVPATPLLRRDTQRPNIRVSGSSKIRTRNSRAKIKGKAADESGIASVEVRVKKAKVRKVRLKKNGKFAIRLTRIKKKRTLVKLYAVDNAGLKSKNKKVVIRKR
jgi:hypothetical protein